MKKYILLLLLMVVSLSSEVYGQKVNRSKSYPTQKAYYPYGYEPSHPLLPQRDTVIIRGEEIEVGSYLSTQWQKSFEIIGYGKAKKSDIRKGFYKIKLKPKQTTTYEFYYVEVNGFKARKGRIVYVSKTAEEKKQLEEKLKATLPRGEFSTYLYTPPGEKPIKITYSQSGAAK